MLIRAKFQSRDTKDKNYVDKLFNMAVNLLEKIDDEFLSCMICMERFKNPKALSCLHTFCADCLENHYRKNRSRVGVLTCPACRFDVQLQEDGVHSLPVNFFVAGLCEVFEAREKSVGGDHDVVCCGCDQQIIDDTSFCLNCRDFLCALCAAHHTRTKQTKTHRVVAGTDMDCMENLIEMRSKSSTTCGHHENEALKLYCENCCVPVCVVCSVTSHRGHNFGDAGTSAERARSTITRLLVPAEDKVSGYQFAIDSAVSAEELLIKSRDETKQNIDEATDKLIANMATAMRRHATNLKNSADGHFTRRQQEIKQYKAKVEHSMEGARNACNYSRKVVQFGSDAEILFANKQLISKLYAVNSAQAEPLRKTGKIQFSQPTKSSGFPQRSDVGTVSLVQVNLTTPFQGRTTQQSCRTVDPQTINKEPDFGVKIQNVQNTMSCRMAREDMLAAVVKAGTRVKRGPDWVWDSQDGGRGSIGTIVRVMEGGWVKVRWNSGKTDNYRMGCFEKYDVEPA